MSKIIDKKRFFPTLDGIRGAAALLILMRHVPYFGDMKFQESYLAVDLFFILSGVVIANAYEQRLREGLSTLQFMWLRVVRIYPMYILGCLITLLYWLWTGTAPAHVILDVVFALFLMPKINEYGYFPMNGPGWSLFSELVGNMLFALIAKRLSNFLLASIIFVSAIFLALTIHFYGNLDIGFLSKTIVFGVVRVGYSFFAGILLYRIYSRKTDLFVAPKVGHLLPWIILFAVLLALVANPDVVARMYFDFFTVVLIFPCIVFVSLYFDPIGKSAHIFKFLGVISYPLYAIHAPLAKWIPVVIGHPAAYFAQNDVLWIGFGFMALITPLAWLLDRYVDSPVRRHILRLGGFVSQRAKRPRIALKPSE